MPYLLILKQNNIQQKNISFLSLMLVKNRKFSTKANSDKPNKPRKRTNSDSPLKLTDYLKQALIGLILGDASLEKPTSNSNIRVRFDQGTIHSGYLFFLYAPKWFMLYTLTPPKSTNRKPDKRTGKIYNSLIFKTRMLPCFNYLWDLFYIDKVKVVPLNIGDLLTAVGLAFWIMDDGGVGSNGTLNLHTDSYTLSEVNLLIEVLKRNFDINSSAERFKKTRAMALRVLFLKQKYLKLLN